MAEPLSRILTEAIPTLSTPLPSLPLDTHVPRTKHIPRGENRAFALRLATRDVSRLTSDLRWCFGCDNTILSELKRGSNVLQSNILGSC